MASKELSEREVRAVLFPSNNFDAVFSGAGDPKAELEFADEEDIPKILLDISGFEARLLQELQLVKQFITLSTS